MRIDHIDVEITGEPVGRNEAAVYARQFQQNHPGKRIKRIEMHVSKANVDGKLWFMPVSFERIPRINAGAALAKYCDQAACAPKYGQWKQI